MFNHGGLNNKLIYFMRFFWGSAELDDCYVLRIWSAIRNSHKLYKKRLVFVCCRPSQADSFAFGVYFEDGDFNHIANAKLGAAWNLAAMQ